MAHDEKNPSGSDQAQGKAKPAASDQAQGEAKRPPGSSRGLRVDQLNVALGVVFAALILVMVNYLAARHFERFDWTSEGLFSVSERTEEVVRGLSQDVEIFLFMSEGERNFADVQELTRTYESLNERVQVTHVDPDRQPARYQVLAERFGIGAMAGPEGVASDVAAVVVSGERRWKITRDDILRFNYEDGGARAVDVQAERAFTGGILQVSEGRPTQVCATTGHGEWDLAAGGERGLSMVREELDRDNVQLRSVETRGQSRLPEDCDAVFVIGPQRAFSAEELGLLRTYLVQGGNVLLTLDPVLDGEQIRPTGFEDLLREHGVEVDRAVALELDPERLLSPSPVEAFAVGDYGDHPITQRLAQMGVPTVMLVSRSVRPAEGSSAQTLLRTSARGYGESDLAQLMSDAELAPGPDDIRGPVSLGVATEIPIAGERAEIAVDEDAPRAGRLVVLGDSDWLRGQFLGTPQFANIDLLGGVTGWLTHRSALISIASRTSELAAVMMTEGDLRGVAFRVLVLMPLAFLLLGLSVWWGRRG